MPACTFSLQHAGTPETLFPVARAAIEEEGGSMSGRPAAGSVSMPTRAGTVKFNFTAQGNRLAIEVTDKPFLVSCALIQSELAEILTEVPAPPPIDTAGEAVPLRPVATRTGGPGLEPPVLEYAFEPEIVYGRRESRELNWTAIGLTALLVAGSGYAVYRFAKRPRRKRTVRV